MYFLRVEYIDLIHRVYQFDSFRKLMDYLNTIEFDDYTSFVVWYVDKDELL